MTLIMQLVLLIIHKFKTFSVDNTQNRPLCYKLRGTHISGPVVIVVVYVLGCEKGQPHLRDCPWIL